MTMTIIIIIIIIILFFFSTYIHIHIHQYTYRTYISMHTYIYIYMYVYLKIKIAKNPQYPQQPKNKHKQPPPPTPAPIWQISISTRKRWSRCHPNQKYAESHPTRRSRVKPPTFAEQPPEGFWGKGREGRGLPSYAHRAPSTTPNKKRGLYMQMMEHAMENLKYILSTMLLEKVGVIDVIRLYDWAGFSRQKSGHDLHVSSDLPWLLQWYIHPT